MALTDEVGNSARLPISEYDSATGGSRPEVTERNLKSFDTLAHNQVTVTNSATQIVAARTTRARVVTIINTHATDTLYVGGSGVTTGNGFPLVAGASKVWTNTAAIYGIRGSSNNITAAYDEEYFA